MSKKIKYEIGEGGKCLTKCPYGKDHKVASVNCKKLCRNFILYDNINKVLICNGDNKNADRN